MRDELVARGEHRGALRERPPGEVGERPAGVEAKPVIARTPRRRHLLGLVDHKWPQPPVLERHRGRDTCGPRAYDDDRPLAHAPTITPPARAVRPRHFPPGSRAVGAFP